MHADDVVRHDALQESRRRPASPRGGSACGRRCIARATAAAIGRACRRPCRPGPASAPGRSRARVARAAAAPRPTARPMRPLEPVTRTRASAMMRISTFRIVRRPTCTWHSILLCNVHSRVGHCRARPSLTNRCRVAVCIRCPPPTLKKIGGATMTARFRMPCVQLGVAVTLDRPLLLRELALRQRSESNARTEAAKLGPNARHRQAAVPGRQSLEPGHLEGAGRSELGQPDRQHRPRQAAASRLRHRLARARRTASRTSSSAATAAKVPVEFRYADESDPGPYPIPPDAPIEGGPKAKGDRHMLVARSRQLEAVRAVRRLSATARRLEGGLAGRSSI